ncbi:DUF4202 domain-containing protein [Methylophilus aquaticus]|uniref:DUF4202 domain-containing protein n=1 Tax=Methylophilus aquaticus TaxID=1971610 RepID=A0ABT9JPK5_9PROT|nr:DUF4202 domain-containing protein [Methylophilus aquaticus]MDP8566509.1 DUF4202 domain-containing protein [Methylophilus aquaticus]
MQDPTAAHHKMSTLQMNTQRFHTALAAFDALNSQDPTSVMVEGTAQSKALVYAHRMSEMLARYAPDASEALQLAARSQHIQRWKIPRSDYPMTKPGYLAWRTKLKSYHAEIATQVLTTHGYDATTISKVCALLNKENLSSDPEMQTLEDVIVLAFLEHDLTEFAGMHPEYSEGKFVDILRKSYLKMSPKGREAALRLIKLPQDLVPLIQKAIG